MADTAMKLLFDIEPDEAEEARLDAEADAAIEAGQFVIHAETVKWLKSREHTDRPNRDRGRRLVGARSPMANIGGQQELLPRFSP